MYDRDIRVQLERSLLKSYRSDRHTRVVEEFDVHRQARIDVAVINGELVGFEIKSPHDTLKRLESQGRLYAGVFDRLTLVVSDHLFRQALDTLPEFWGIVVVSGDGHIVLENFRRPTANDCVRAESLVKLLWREEALTALDHLGAAVGVRGKARKHVWERLADSVSLAELKQIVRETLRARKDWRAGESSSRCDD